MPVDATREVAESAWRWVLDQVEDDGSPWIPESVTGQVNGPPVERDGLHSGTAGLAHALAEVRASRAWTRDEQTLAGAIAERLDARTSVTTASDYFDGLVGNLGALIALDADGADAVVDRLISLAEADGWTQEVVRPPRFRPAARISDATLGTASVLLGGLWAQRHGVPRADVLVERAAVVLMGEAEEVPAGLRWRFVPMRFRTEDDPTEMPNWSHGQAGVAAALALAGAQLDRPAWVEAARRGAEHLVSIGDTSDGGLAVPRYVPHRVPDEDPVAMGWCHGASGTSLLFAALDHARVPDVAGAAPAEWRSDASGRSGPRGCRIDSAPGSGTTTVGAAGPQASATSSSTPGSRAAVVEDLDFALRLGDALVQRAHVAGPHAWWRFVEHRADPSVLPPGVGWMQGAAGIAAYLFRVGRVLEHGQPAAAVPRLDTWWAGPGARPSG